MGCSVFASSHNDPGPTNIIINGNWIMILDWEMAGYAPLESRRNGRETGARQISQTLQINPVPSHRYAL